MSRSSLIRKLKPKAADSRDDMAGTLDESMPWSDATEDEAVLREALSDPDHADYALINAYLGRELSPAAQERVEERLRMDPQFRAMAEPLQMIWSLPGRLTRQPELVNQRAGELAWERLRRRIELEKLGIHTPTLAERRARRRWGIHIGFGAVGVWFVMWLFTSVLPRWPSVPGPYVHLDAPIYRSRSAKLPDETQVTLAPGSHVSYSHLFAHVDQHKLTLDGEATFTVVPASGEPPLVVDGPGVEVRAYAGRFTVEAFAPRPFAYVRVDEGLVQVRARTVVGYGEALTLRAGEGVRVGPFMDIQRTSPPIAPHRSRPPASTTRR